MQRFTVSPVPSARSVDRSDWDRLCPAGHPFLNQDFFDTLERRGASSPQGGWRACHWVARDPHGGVAGLVPSYLKAHSHGDFVRDWGWARAYEQAGAAYYPRLVSGLPFTPAAGPRVLVRAGPEAAALARRIVEAVKDWVSGNRLSSWHVALPTAADVELLRSNGLLVSHDVQFHWHDRGYRDFDDFLSTFSSEKRGKVRAERRRVAQSGVAIETMHGDEVPAGEWMPLHRMYAATFDKYGNYAALSARCFADLGRALGRRMVLFVARERGAPVAVAICFRSDEALYGRYWGALGDRPGLHFELCLYQGIAYCLREGLKRFEPGADGEHKIARGFEPTVVRSCHWIEDARMRAAIGRHLGHRRDAVRAYAEEAAAHLPFRGPLRPAPIGSTIAFLNEETSR